MGQKLDLAMSVTASMTKAKAIHAGVTWENHAITTLTAGMRMEGTFAALLMPAAMGRMDESAGLTQTASHQDATISALAGLAIGKLAMRIPTAAPISALIRPAGRQLLFAAMAIVKMRGQRVGRAVHQTAK